MPSGLNFCRTLPLLINTQVVKINKIVDGLSRINFLLQVIQVNTLGFDGIKEMCKDDVDFKDAYASCENPVSNNRS